MDMDVTAILEIVWKVLNSPAVIAVLAGGLLWLLNKLYAAKPAWQALEGTIIAAVKWAEKEIPDDTPNAGLAKLDAALRFVLKAYADANNGKQPPAKLIEEIKQGIQIKHSDLDRFGGLSKSST